MKFRFLLWMLGRLMAKASRTNPDFQQQLAGKELVFQLHTLDGKVSRQFIIKNQRVSSRAGVSVSKTWSTPAASFTANPGTGAWMPASGWPSFSCKCQSVG